MSCAPSAKRIFFARKPSSTEVQSIVALSVSISTSGCRDVSSPTALA
jgi:hypothetical protein